MSRLPHALAWITPKLDVTMDFFFFFFLELRSRLFMEEVFSPLRGDFLAFYQSQSIVKHLYHSPRSCMINRIFSWDRILEDLWKKPIPRPYPKVMRAVVCRKPRCLVYGTPHRTPMRFLECNSQLLFILRIATLCFSPRSHPEA
jgi:hypothetical protein